MMKQHKDKKKGLVALVVALVSALLLYFGFGIFTAIIENAFFIRMTPVGWLEKFALISTSALIGLYIGLAYYGKTHQGRVCNASATGGGVFGFLTFGCSICNKILVSLLGVAGVLSFIEPLKPLFILLSLSLLVFAIFIKAKALNLV